MRKLHNKHYKKQMIKTMSHSTYRSGRSSLLKVEVEYYRKAWNSILDMFVPLSHK